MAGDSGGWVEALDDGSQAGLVKETGRGDKFNQLTQGVWKKTLIVGKRCQACDGGLDARFTRLGC